jgi:hypothetical protein
MPLGPIHAACVQPAPKSRFVVSGLSRTKIKINIDGNGNGNGSGSGSGSGNGNGNKGVDRSHAPRANAVKDALRPK